MKKIVLSALAVAALAGTAMAQPRTVDLEIVSLGTAGGTAGAFQVAPDNRSISITGATSAITVYLAVRGRVTSTTNQFLSDWGGTIRADGELDSYGTLGLLRISNPSTDVDGNPVPVTKHTGALAATGGVRGLADTYRALNINGTINPAGADGTPNQEIFNIGARLQGENLIRTAGASTYTGDPDYTFSDPINPPPQSVAELNWGRGVFSELFRFSYTITDTSTLRNTQFSLIPADVGTASEFTLTSGLWGVISQLTQPTSNVGFSINVVPAPGAAALLGLGGLVAARRRRTA